MRRAAASLIALASATFVVPALAQSSNEAAAQKLFDEGRVLMTASRFDEACQKFEASEKLSPAGGTLFNLGDCYEKAEKPASAWARYNEAADRASALHRPDAEKFARDRANALTGSLAFIKVEIDPSLKSIEGLVITIDAAPLASAGWDTPIPADPGAHEIRATAPGKKPWSTQVAVAGQGSTSAVRIDALEDEPLPPAEPPRDSLPVDSSRGSTERMIGLGVGALGIVGVGLGSFFGLAAMSKHNGIACPND
ncbi:MAG: tetratricopeptide repeat protein, partial [Polyangiaceae bacterium]